MVDAELLVQLTVAPLLQVAVVEFVVDPALLTVLPDVLDIVMEPVKVVQEVLVLIVLLNVLMTAQVLA